MFEIIWDAIQIAVNIALIVLLVESMRRDKK